MRARESYILPKVATYLKHVDMFLNLLGLLLHSKKALLFRFEESQMMDTNNESHDISKIPMMSLTHALQRHEVFHLFSAAHKVRQKNGKRLRSIHGVSSLTEGYFIIIFPDVDHIHTMRCYNFSFVILSSSSR